MTLQTLRTLSHITYSLNKRLFIWTIEQPFIHRIRDVFFLTTLLLIKQARVGSKNMTNHDREGLVKGPNITYVWPRVIFFSCVSSSINLNFTDLQTDKLTDTQLCLALHSCVLPCMVLWGHRNLRIQKFRDLRIQGSKDIGIQGFRDLGI